MGLNANVDLTAEQCRIILGLLRTHLPNVTVWAYGSRVRWNARPYSDLDLVAFTSPGQESQLANLKDAFEESPLPFEVDLLAWDNLPESFHRRIKQEYAVLQEHVPKAGRVGSEWPHVAIGEITEVTISNVDKKSKLGEQPVHLCNYTDVYYNRFIRSDLNFLAATATEREITRCSLNVGDVIITKDSEKYDDIGVPALIREEIPNLVCGYHLAILRPLSQMLEGAYLFYALGIVAVQHQFHSIANGVTRFGLPKNDIGNVKIPLPPLPEQRAIAHVLGTLDDKIEQNRRMNETLEAMARALFKSWFIDFDPVHAKATLKQQAASEITPPLRGSRQDKGASPQARRWGVIRRGYTQRTLTTAQTLRRTRTDAEGLLWHYLRHNQLDGHRFRRQHPIGPYIVDFACLARKVLIELDGSQHAERQADDKKRDAFLRAQGYRVLRFWNNEIFENCFGVLERIYETVTENPPPKPSAPDGLTAPTPPQRGSDWTVERARAYLDGMSPEIAALFPDRFVDSELGEIPYGWEVSKIGEEVEVVGGSTPSTKDARFWNGSINWVTPKDLSSLKFPVLLETSRRITKEGLAKISSGLLPRGTVLLSSRAPIGYIAIADVPVAVNQGFIAMKCHKRISAVHAWLWASTNLNLILENANGSTFLEISKSNFRPLPMIVPSEPIRCFFNELVESLLERMIENERQSCILFKLRDTLLPKLINGELRSPDPFMESANVQ